MFFVITVLGMLISHTAFATSTSTNAIYNNGWQNVGLPLPAILQTNVFNSTGAAPALTVSGGDPDFSNSTNTFNGNLIFSGGNPTLGGKENTINGSIAVSGGIANLDSCTNIVNGNITISGGYADLSGSTNRISGILNMTDGYATLGIYSCLDPLKGTTSKTPSSNSINAITMTGGTMDLYGGVNTFGSLTVSRNGFIDLRNSQTTITNITLAGGGLATPYSTAPTPPSIPSVPGGYIVMGGGQSTQVENFNWSGGSLGIVVGSNRDSGITFNTLSITGPVNLMLVDKSDVSTTLETLTQNPGLSYTLFKVGTFSGDPNNIKLINTSPFTEVVTFDSSLPNRVNLTPDGKVTVNLVPVEVMTDSTTLSAVTGAIDQAVMNSLVKMEGYSNQTFASNSGSKVQTFLNMQQAFKENSTNPFETAMTAFSQTSEPMIKFKGDYRVWLTPYAIRIRNTTTSGSGFSEKNYGLIVGISHYLKNLAMNLSFLMGTGASNTQQEAKPNSKNNGKSLILGLTAVKSFFDEKVEVISSLYGIGAKNTQFRQVNPSPSQSYIAFSRYKSAFVSWQNEAGYILKLKDGYSLRPSLGMQLLTTYRSAFNEQNADRFNHSYRRRSTKSGEVYAGLGLRKKWLNDQFEGKLTAIYEIGRIGGNGKSAVTVYAKSVPLGVNFANKSPGQTVHYLNLYGSILDKNSHWKIKPGCSVILQKGQKSIGGRVSFEYRF